MGPCKSSKGKQQLQNTVNADTAQSLTDWDNHNNNKKISIAAMVNSIAKVHYKHKHFIEIKQ